MPGSIRTHLLPPAETSVFGPDDVAIVVDVLRATTVMIAALDAGTTAIHPCSEIDEARARATTIPNALLCGERTGLPIPGFDLGNSPGDFVPKLCRNRELVMTTTNGTRAVLASIGCRAVVPMAFTNVSRVVRALAATQRRVHFVCAGTDGQISWEDALACGLAADRMIAAGHDRIDDATRIAVSVFRECLNGVDLRSEPGRLRLVEVLKQGRGGQRVTEIGCEKDIVEVARTDDFDILAQVVAAPWRIVRTDEIP